MPFYVYILEGSDGSYYTGLTRKHPEQRLWEHNAGVVEGSSTRGPVVLKCAEEFASALDAINRERQIKGWSRRKKKALIAADYESLPSLAKTTITPKT
ncbi:GIY-YIG nuclease family protein [Devosia aurantiaca]|uniref:GIY-YIG nuclease family protein n=1 Tax=Devosia aurantiaca TaxID=2714858 RepID=A0A6M1SQB2_9HYPH|nr:GIY-YIG nuclease family protein [Devosia aurantiaca]NGP17662.1 GIY-YIG nuclease family protein [Devosia aurantiaca]